MRVVALFRVSTEKQASEGASLDAQARTYRDLAGKFGWETVEEFRGCESATQAASDRRVLQQVLACIREREPDAVYVHEQSRLTRGDQLEVALLMRELAERGTKIIVHGAVRDLGSIDDEFMVGVQSAVDRAESRRIKERMIRGKREKARQGKKNSGPAPFGYVNPPPGSEGRGKLRIVPEEAVVVRKLFALAAAGKGETAIADALNDAGMRASRGGRWAKSSVRKVLMNPAYIGTAASGVWVRRAGRRGFDLDLKNDRAILVEEAHEAIIDKTTWDAVHNRNKPPRTMVPRLLSGLLWINGVPAHGDTSRNGTYYRGPRGMRGCPWLWSKETDRAVWQAFASLATGPEFVERIMSEAQTAHERLVLTQEIDYLSEQIGKAQRRLKQLLVMRTDNEIDKATYLAGKEEQEASIAQWEEELRNLRSKFVTCDATVAARVASAVQVLLAGSSKLTVEQRRALLGSIVRRVDVTAENTGLVQKRGPGGKLAGSGGPKWAVSRVDFRLALPEGGSPTGPIQANVRLPVGDAAGSGAQNRDGQLVPTS